MKKIPKLAKPLTDVQFKSYKPKDKTWTLPDGSDLYLEIVTNGKKSWRMAYRKLESKTNNQLSFVGLYKCQFMTSPTGSWNTKGLNPFPQEIRKLRN